MMDNVKTSRKIKSPAAAAGRVVLIYAVFAALWVFASDTALEALVRNPTDLARVGMFKGLLFVVATALLLYVLLIRLLKTTGEAQQAFSAHYAKLIEQARDIVLLIDPAGRIVEANRAAEAAYGYPHAELLGMLADDLRSPDSLADVERQWTVAARTEGVLFETRHCHRDGRVFPVEVSSRAIEIEGKLYRQSFIRDITERKQAGLLITQSEQRLELAVGGAGLGLWDWQAPTGELTVNDRWRSMLGLDPAGPTPTIDLWHSLVHVDDLPKLDQLFKDVIMNPTGRDFEIEIRARHQDGHYLWIFDKGHVAERAADGSPLRVVGTHLDISARKSAAEALQHTQALLAKAEKIGRVGGWEIDIQTLQTTWTEAVYDIHELNCTDRLTVDEGINYYTPESQPIIEQAVRRALDQGKPFDLELEIITAKGNRRSVHAMGEADLARGKVSGFFQDITERVRARESFNKFFEQPMGLNLIAKLDGVIQRVNQSMANLLGYSSEHLAGINFLDLVHPEDRAATIAEMGKLAHGTNTLYFENRYRQKSGEIRLLAWSASVSTADQLIFAVATDITERKLTAEALQETQAMLARTEEIGKLGGWEFDIDTLQQTWTKAVYAIHEVDFTGQLTVEQGISFYTPESRPIIEQAVQCAIEHGEPFDLELEIITAKGNLRAVHTIGRHDPVRGKIIGFFQDITERKKTEEDLRESEYRWRFAIEGSGDGLWDWDIQNDHVFYSERWKAILGLQNDDIGNSPEVWASHLHPDDKDRVFAEVQSHLDGQTAHYASEHRVLCKDGSLKWLLGRGLVIQRDANEKPLRMIGTNTDITERKRAEESLQQAATVFGHSREGITITGTDGTILDVNEAFTRITGYSREDAIGQNPKILSSGRHTSDFYKEMWDALIDQGYWSGEIWNRRKDGEVYAELMSISAIRDGQGVTQQYVAMFADITAIKAHQSQLEHMAHFDALTNLPNRFLMADRLHQAMAQAQRRQQHLVVVYLDLDGFKAVNDQYGHETGDQVLIVLAKRFKEALREGDTLARISGDEFVAVLTDLEDTSASLPLLNRLQAAAELPVELGELSLSLSASLGVTFYPQAQDIDGDQLLRQADQAMYEAKQAGKNRCCIFDAAVDSNVRKQHGRLARIRLALERHEFVLYYQPKVNMRTGKVIGAEALIRWQHPEDGLLAPATFLPTFEDHPLAVDVGEWVIDTAMRQMEVWRAAGLDLPVSVNIGARQLLQDDFVERLQRILVKHPNVQPGCIELEVLETSALSDMDQVSQLIEDCAEIGMRFALDDFGTGYSSLTYLKRLRVNVLKIDQSFVRDMLDDPDDLAILQGIIGLAAAFNREVIAEGVETVAHGTALLQLGCELAQGYGIARPMPPDQLPAWAATWRPDAAWGGVKNPDEAPRSTDK